MVSDFSKRKVVKSNRLNYLIAIIFFIFLSLVYKLYDVQILKNDRYLNLAKMQHNSFSELKAKRGSIYLDLGENKFHPLAINKEYAAVYINPRALSEESILEILDHFYTIFHQEDVEKEVDSFLKEEDEKELKQELDYVNSLNLLAEEKELMSTDIINRRANLKLNKEWLDFREAKRSLEIEERKQLIINDYFTKVNYKDKYSRLVKRKIEKEDLLKIYFSILKDDLSLENYSDLYIKAGNIYSLDNKNISALIHGLHYEWESFRYYPEKTLLSQALGFSNLENIGNYGLEGFFDHELRGQDGFLLSDKGSYQGRKIIIDKKEYQAPIDGSSLVLTIDYAVQLNICQKLEEAEKKHKFDSASIIVMDPKTGRIIAMCSWPNFDPNNYQEVKDLDIFDNQLVSHQYEPGSVFKTITMAIAIDQGKISPNTFYEDKGYLNIKGWSKAITNSDFSSKGGHGWVDMNYVLENSLNTGAIFAASQVDPKIYADYLKKFGFGEKSGIELSSESSGNINNLLKNNIKEIDYATASFGQGLAVSPLQMISAYASLANKGVLMKPYIVDRILDSDNNIIKQVSPQIVRQVVSAETAETVSAMLVNVVENGHAKKSQIEGYYIGGKTGTAQIPSPSGGYLQGQYIHNFLGYAPINDPKFVLLVKFDSPKTSVFAEGTVVPVFGEIVDFLLNYYKIPKERK